MANTKEFDGEYEEADSIENPGVGVRWTYARSTDELAALALEFGFSADRRHSLHSSAQDCFQSRCGNDSLNYRSSMAREL